jgi:hypothetical protein
MASAARSRHTVLALSGLPTTAKARAVTSGIDSRLKGRPVSGTSSHAPALRRVCFSGGKIGLCALGQLHQFGRLPHSGKEQQVQNGHASRNNHAQNDLGPFENWGEVEAINSAWHCPG